MQTRTCLNQTELAARWTISARTLERWRWTGDGPAFLKIGGRVVYRLEDVLAYLCVRDMHLRTAEETVDPDTGEVIPVFVRILPTGYMCAQSGALLPVENPEVWVDQEGEDA